MENDFYDIEELVEDLLEIVEEILPQAGTINRKAELKLRFTERISEEDF